MTSFHCSGVILWNMASRVMPALLTRISIGPRSASTVAIPVGAGLVVGDIPLVGRNAGVVGEGLRLLVIAGVVGGDLVSGALQRDGYRRADAACIHL